MGLAAYSCGTGTDSPAPALVEPDMSPPRRPAAVEPIVIGAVYSTTGGMKWIDIPGLNGFLLAAQQINHQGGLLGRPLKVVHVDGATDSAQVRRAVTEMVEVHRAVALGGLNDGIFALAPRAAVVRRAGGGLTSFRHSELALTAAPIATSAGIPVVSAGSTLPELPDLVGDHLFMVVPGTEAQALAIAQYATDVLGARTSAILVDQSHGYTTALAGFFAQAWAQNGGQVVAEEPYPPGRLDIAHPLQRLRALRPDALFLATLPNDAGILVRQVRQAGLAQPILAADWFDTPYIEAYAEDLADDIYFATQAVLQDPDQDMQAFIEAYQGEYEEVPPNAFAVLGYDALRLIADAIERAGSAAPDAIRDSLAQTSQFPALSGPITYPAGQNRPLKPVAVVQVQDGEIALADRIIPEE